MYPHIHSYIYDSIKNYKPHKRRGFGGISNLIMFPVIVMLMASLFATSPNKGLASNNVPYIQNGTSPICIATSSNPFCITQVQTNQTNAAISQNAGGCGWNLICQAQCYFFSTIGGNQCQVFTQNQTIASVSNTNPTPSSIIQLLFNPLNGNGFITILPIAVGAVLLLGITVFGTGINPASIYLAFMISLYIAVWSVLSILAQPTFNSLPTLTTSDGYNLNTGLSFYSFLTLLYALGVMQRLG